MATSRTGVYLQFPLDLSLSADPMLQPDTQIELIGDYNLVELVHDESFNNCIISRDVLQAAFFYENVNDETFFRFTNNPVIKNAFISSINNCLSYNTLQLYDLGTSSPTQYPAPRLQAKYPDRKANMPTVCDLPDQYIQFFATLLFNNPQTLGPFSNLQDIIEQMQYGLKGKVTTTYTAEDPHVPGLATTGSNTLGDQAYTFIKTTEDINNDCQFTKNIYQQILGDAPERFDQTDTTLNKVLSIPFLDGDVIALDVRMYGTLSVDQGQGALIRKIIDMFPSGTAHINNYFIYDANTPNLLQVKPFTYRIRLIVGEPQNISRDPILYANGKMNSLFTTTAVPIDEAYDTILETESLSLPALTNTVYTKTETSPAQKEKNQEAMNDIHGLLCDIVKDYLQSNPSSTLPTLGNATIPNHPNFNNAIPPFPQNIQRDNIKIVINLLKLLSNCMMLFVNMNVAELISENVNSNEEINIVGIAKSFKVCSQQLAILLNLAYNPIMPTQDMYYFILKHIPIIVAAMIDIANYSTNLISSSDQKTLTYAFSKDLSVATANVKILAFANTPYLPIDPLTHLPVESQRIPLIKISDLLSSGGVLETICYMFIALGDTYKDTHHYGLRNVNENRRNYPEPNSVIAGVRACFDNIRSVDIISYTNTFMPKLFHSVTSICDLISILLKPHHFDLKGYILNYIDDIDRGNMLEALTHGAAVKSNTLIYSYTYNKTTNPSTLVYGSNTILDAINYWPLGNSQDLYKIYATSPTYPLGGNSTPIGELTTGINNDILTSINPSSDIKSTSNIVTYPISNKVHKIINVEQYDDQVSEIYKLLVEANLTNIEEFSFALLNTSAYINTRRLLLQGMLIVQQSYSETQDYTSQIGILSGDTSAYYTQALTALQSIADANKEIDTAYERAYYEITQNSLQSAMIYISFMIALANLSFDSWQVNKALLIKLQYPESTSLSNEYDLRKEQFEISKTTVDSLVSLYGYSKPVVSNTYGNDQGPGVLTTVYNMLVSSATFAASKAQLVYDDMLPANANKPLALTTINEMNGYKTTLSTSITFTTPMGSDLKAVKRLYYAIILTRVIVAGMRLVRAIDANSEINDNDLNLSQHLTEFTTQKTTVASIAAAYPA